MHLTTFESLRCARSWSTKWMSVSGLQSTSRKATLAILSPCHSPSMRFSCAANASYPAAVHGTI